jgi:integrase
VPRLTDSSIKALPLPSTGHKTYWDRPLGVRVAATGVKTYIVILDSGRRKAIGRVGAISLKDARTSALRLKADHQPSKYSKPAVDLPTARTEYLAAADVRSNTRIYYERNLCRLPDLPLPEITHDQIQRILDALSPSSRSQALRTYTAFFAWAIRRHYLDNSPCVRMQADKHDARARVLTDEELGEIWSACELRGEPSAGHAGDRSIPSPVLPANFCAIVQLLMLTGMRRSECAALEARYFREDLCTLPSALCKNAHEHSFPIGDFSKRLLAPFAAASPSGYLFAARGHTDRPFSGWSKAKSALDSATGITDWTLHDLRRTYRTIHARIGTPPHIAERLVNHVSSRSEVEAIYDRFNYLEPMRIAVRNFDDFIGKLISGNHAAISD